MNSMQIKYFLSLAEHKNFTTTAKILYSSQPTISKQIAALEKELGFTLFFRSNRNVSLTPAGMVFLKTFTEMTDQYKNSLKRVQDIYTKRDNSLLLGCVQGMEISSLLNKIFQSFREHFPNVEYQLECHSPGNLIKALNNGDLDAIITTESFINDDPNLSYSIFLNAKHMLYISASSLHLSNSSFNLSSLKDELFFVLSSTAFPNAKDYFFKWCKENNITPNRIQYVPNVESEMLSVEAGLGVTIADSIFRLHTNPLIREIELNTSHNIFVVWKKNNKNLLISSFVNLASQINALNKND